MPTFSYQAVRRSGERVAGEVTAQSRSEAFDKLDKQKLQPLTLDLKNEGPATPGTAAASARNASVAKSALAGVAKEGNGASSTLTVTPVVPSASAPAKPAATGPAKMTPTPPAGKSAAAQAGAPPPGTKMSLSRKQLIIFTEELSDLLEAGLQLEPALRVMQERQEAGSVKTIAAALRQYVREGTSLSAALRRVSTSFGDLYCNLVSAGEVSGALHKILRRQLDYLIMMQTLQGRVLQAMLYPAFILLAAVALVFIFTLYLIPQLKVLLNATTVSQPIITRIMLASSEFMIEWWWLVLGLMVGAAIGFRTFITRSPGREWWDEAQLRMPLVGNILRARFYTQFCQTLSTLIMNGIPLLGALKLVQAATGNVYFSRLLARVVDLVGEGAPLSRSITRVGGFPAVLVDMIIVGEQTGDLGLALDKAGNRYDKDLTRKIETMTTLIQPAVIVVMAVLVGAVAYSMMQGIFSAMNGMRVRGS